MRRCAFFVGMALVLVMAFLHFLAARPSEAQGNALAVTNLADAGPGSLRQAIASAGAGDRITFAITGTILLSSSLVVSRDLTVDGGGAIVLDGRGTTGILEHQAGALTLRGLALQNGKRSRGAAILQANGDLKLEDCRLLNNSASVGGAIASDEGPRDGLSGPVGSTTLIRAVVEGNQAEYAGGAISSRHRVTIRDSVIRGNRAGSFGGGLDLVAPLTMSRSLLAGNRAGSNGSAAIVNDAVMDNCLIAENLVDGPRPYPDAAAIDSRAWLRLIHCTVAGNGVLHGDQGSALHQSVSYYFGDERIQQTRLVASLIIGNHPANCWGGIIDGGGNLQFPGNSCGESLSTMPVSFVEERDPSGLLRALIPRDDSTAVDAAADGSCLSDPVLAVDARGRARPYSQRPGATTACDIGAFESGSAATSTPGYRPRATATSEPADLIVYPASYDEVCPGPDTGLPRLAVRNQGPSGASATDLEVLGLRYPVPALAPGQKVIINLAEWSGPFDAVDPENKVRELVEDNNSPHGNVPVLWSRPELTCTPIPTLPSQSPTRTPTRLPPPTSLPSFLPDAWFQDVIWSRECQTGKRQVQPCLSTRGPAAAAAYRVVSEPPGLSWDIDPAVAACGEPRLAPPDLTALRIDPQNLIQERSEINNRRGVPPPDFPPRSACTATPTATSTPSAEPTMTPTPTNAPTRRPTATRSPTRTRTPSPTVGPGWTRRLSLPRLESAP
ncbi:MAG: hypothetical protein IPJ58_06380 [Ardenticatenia bacterium]|nr:hypothetical protein [Ardenticatenia bacterium]